MKPKNIVIIGASGHGEMILDCLESESKYTVVGFVDSFIKRGIRQNGYEVLGSEADLPMLFDKFNLHGGIIAIGDNWTRKLISDSVEDLVPEFEFITTIHPSAVLGKEVEIGKGNAVMPGVIVNAGSVIGDFCILNTGCSLGHDGKMGNYSSIASGACIGGNLTLGEYSAISLGANIVNNIVVGEHTVIGAGSLVVKNIQGYSVAYGSPATIVRKRSIGDAYLNTSDNSKN